MLLKLWRKLRQINFRPSPADFLLAALAATAVMLLVKTLFGGPK